MATQDQIHDRMKSLIPSSLWEKHVHLTYAEMAEIPELAEYADELMQAESDWFDAE